MMECECEFCDKSFEYVSMTNMYVNWIVHILCICAAYCAFGAFVCYVVPDDI